MEQVITVAITHQLQSSDLIADSQHRFRSGRSCLTNLLIFLDKVTRAIDLGHIVDVIYLDVAKAFDMVPSQRFLKKVAAHGITGQLLQWIKN